MLSPVTRRAVSGSAEARFARSLRSFLQKMATTPDLDALLRHAFDVVRRALPVDAMFIAMLTEDRRYLKLLETDLDDRGSRVFCARRPAEPNSSSVLETLGQHRFVLLHRTKEEMRRLSGKFVDGEPWTPVGNPNRRSASLLYVPIWEGPVYSGAVSVQSYRRNAYRSEDVERLITVSDYIGLAIRHARPRGSPRGNGRRGID
jgi:GAF domain-containing protein